MTAMTQQWSAVQVRQAMSAWGAKTRTISDHVRIQAADWGVVPPLYEFHAPTSADGRPTTYTPVMYWPLMTESYAQEGQTLYWYPLMQLVAHQSMAKQDWPHVHALLCLLATTLTDHGYRARDTFATIHLYYEYHFCVHSRLWGAREAPTMEEFLRAAAIINHTELTWLQKIDWLERTMPLSVLRQHLSHGTPYSMLAELYPKRLIRQ